MNTEDAFEDWTAKYVRNVRIQEKCIELMQDYADKKKKKSQPTSKGFPNSGIQLTPGRGTLGPRTPV